MAIEQDMILDLNFVPDWARKPPEGAKFSDYQKKGGDDSRGKGGGAGRNFRGKRPESSAPRNRSYGGDRQRDERSARPVAGPRENRTDIRPPVPDVQVSFIPERRGLKPLAMKLARTGRAFSLMDVAHMFVSNPRFYAVKYECPDSADSTDAKALFQCVECKLLFSRREAAAKHVFEKHFDLFYSKEEIEIESPKGNFVCVARCGLSGTLLGPPNYHGYNDKVMELHTTMFPHMPLDDYRNRISNETDPAIIEQWKESARKQVRYTVLDAKEPTVFERKHDAEQHFNEKYAKTGINEGRRFIIAGVVAEHLEDPGLARLYEEARQRESRFPLKMSIAIRPAFRHLGLHTFKVGDKAIFVTSIQPNAIDPESAADLVKTVLNFLLENPGTDRNKLVESLKPGCSPDSEEFTAIMGHLRWLIDKGHVIEFYDGKLSVPRI